jgi:hypothetical protein
MKTLAQHMTYNDVRKSRRDVSEQTVHTVLSALSALAIELERDDILALLDHLMLNKNTRYFEIAVFTDQINVSIEFNREHKGKHE